jgi:hypothetical protein
LKEFRELHTEEENICRDWSHREKSYTENLEEATDFTREEIILLLLLRVGDVLLELLTKDPSVPCWDCEAWSAVVVYVELCARWKSGVQTHYWVWSLQISYNCVCSAVLVWVRGCGYDADDDADGDEKPRSWIWLELFMFFIHIFVCLLLGSLFWGLPIHGMHVY